MDVVGEASKQNGRALTASSALARNAAAARAALSSKQTEEKRKTRAELFREINRFAMMLSGNRCGVVSVLPPAPKEVGHCLVAAWGAVCRIPDGMPNESDVVAAWRDGAADRHGLTVALRRVQACGRAPGGRP